MKLKRTLIALDSCGALEDFSNVFDLKKWNQEKTTYIYELRLQYGRKPYATDNLNYFQKYGGVISSLASAKLSILKRKLLKALSWIIRKFRKMA